MIAIFDDGTSFAHNIAQLIGMSGATPIVVEAADADLAVLSQASGIVVAAESLSPAASAHLARAMSDVPTLGIGHGFYWFAEQFGARFRPAREPMHGKADAVVHDGRDLFEGVPSPLRAVRYDARVLVESSLPDRLVVTCRSEKTGVVLGMRHTSFAVFGVQFHPHSAFTDDGHLIIENFLALTSAVGAAGRGRTSANS